MFTYLTLVQLLSPLGGDHEFYSCPMQGTVVTYLGRCDSDPRDDHEYIVEFKCITRNKVRHESFVVCHKQLERVNK